MYTRYAHVCHGTKRVSSPKLVEKGRNHVALMTGNPAFPDPHPSLAEVARACDELERASLAYSFNRGRQDLVARNEAHHRLRRLIICLAGYVQASCHGNRMTALSAGFETKRKRAPSVIVDAPCDVRAQRSDFAGSIHLRWAGVKGRKIYSVYMTDGDPGLQGEWRLLTQTSKNYLTVNGLLSGRPYTFRVVAFGALGDGPASDIATAKAA